MRIHRPVAALALGILAASVFIASAFQDAPDPKEQAKVYEDALREMTGQPFGKVLKTVQDWGFEAAESWEAVDPNARDVARLHRRKPRFTRKEIREIFGPDGSYRVVVYRKLVGRDEARVGSIDRSGMSQLKDQTVIVERHTVIRLVFRDEALVESRVWPILE